MRKVISSGLSLYSVGLDKVKHQNVAKMWLKCSSNIIRALAVLGWAGEMSRKDPVGLDIIKIKFRFTSKLSLNITFETVCPKC